MTVVVQLEIVILHLSFIFSCSWNVFKCTNHSVKWINE